MIHVCPLSLLHKTVEDTGARHVVSLIGDEVIIERPSAVVEENYLRLRLHDISSPLDGYIMPDEEHIADLLRFVRRWDRRAPMVVHCYAGISRSTASAFASVCAMLASVAAYVLAPAVNACTNCSWNAATRALSC